MTAATGAPEVVTVGSATEDVFIMTKGLCLIRLETCEAEKSYFALPSGAKIDVDEMFISTGGGACNTAVTFRRFGFRTSVAAKVGDDRSGRTIRERLEAESIGTHMLAADPAHRTGYAAILMGFSAERTVLVYRGATLHLTEADIDWDCLRQAKLVYVGSLSGESARLYPRVAAFCAEHGIQLAANPGGTQFRAGVEAFRDVLQHLDMLFLNKEEAYTFTRIEPRRGWHDEREMLRILREAGPRCVIMTEGPRGCQAVDGEAHYTVPACKVKAVSTLGAGDAFGSATAAAMVRGEPLARALRYGAVNAAAVVSQIGAKRGILTWEKATEGVVACEVAAPSAGGNKR
jgi:ribokinase